MDSGPGRLLAELQHQAEVVCHLLRERHLLLHPRHGPAVAPRGHQALRRVLHLREHCCLSQHVLPDGPRQAAEEDVRDHAAARHRHHACVFRAYPVRCSVVAQEGAGPALLHPAVPVHDLVQPVVHPVRKGRRHEVLLFSPELRTRTEPAQPLEVAVGLVEFS
ncbi:vesicle transport protein SFT2A isoform X1 [Eptesicus fuscus]|uniref:vesicle transport protein SFT2A isoform X1 n=1 Tax=Eptesicus fuscus TaxID=29078 RepID=UPI0024040155|nr:vesicle transport protein SFT2A isoform X1 [Eptesicus fuscus]XP_054578500.1 vesicle transport protein SFT2A isoform X1 [Eptesicus fuscus]